MKFISTPIATFFFTGYLPKMPGTWGSLAALPLAWFLWQYSLPIVCIFLVLLAILGTWAAHQYDKESRTKDNKHIVIDEVLGILIAASLAQHRLLDYAMVFLLFRFFDIWKPFPVSWFDQNVSGGLGVMLDDVVAGLIVVLLFFISSYFL